MDEETKEVIARAELPGVFKGIRVALGLSQEQMAHLTGISRVMISYYETADSVPTMTTFNKWLDAVTEEIGILLKDIQLIQKIEEHRERSRKLREAYIRRKHRLGIVDSDTMRLTNGERQS